MYKRLPFQRLYGLRVAECAPIYQRPVRHWMDMQLLFHGHRSEPDRTHVVSRGPRYGSDEPPRPESLSHVPWPLRISRWFAPQPLLLHRSPSEPGATLWAAGRASTGLAVLGTIESQARTVSESLESSGRVVFWWDLKTVFAYYYRYTSSQSYKFRKYKNYKYLLINQYYYFCIGIAECRIRGSLMFELHAIMAEDARRSQQDTNVVMEALLVSFRASSGLAPLAIYNKLLCIGHTIIRIVVNWSRLQLVARIIDRRMNIISFLVILIY